MLGQNLPFNMNGNNQIPQMGMGQMNMNPMMQMNPGMPQNNHMAMQMNNPLNFSINQQNNNVETRIRQEFNLCVQDNDLVQIGCNFGLENNNIYVWRITMSGPTGTPYQRGLFTLNAFFPNDYPNHGPDFRFKNKIYHLNVDFQKDIGHICINSLNSWRTSGQVRGHDFFTVKQALFDIFSLFYKQGVDSAYDESMADLYQNNRAQFDANAAQCTKMYANPNMQ